jgi:hypothetical protein
MEPKKRHGYVTNRKRFKWWIKNNVVFVLIIGIICVIVALIFAAGVYNFERVKSMEAILDRDLRTIHRKTGLTDSDVERLKKEHPDFQWEKTWDRSRWQSSQTEIKEERNKTRAQRNIQKEKKKRLLQLESKRIEQEKAMNR